MNETSADNVNQTEISVSDSFTSNQINGASAHSPSRETVTNEASAHSPSRETVTNEPSSTESAPGFPRGNIEASDDNDTTETPQFESRAAAMSSLNADATANSSCVTDDGKIEEKNSRPELKESHEGELNGVQVTEENPFLQSVKYLEKHQILRLFQVRLARDNFINKHRGPLA